ncbi:MAG: hypothetical protein LJE69_10030 [Thiohalocapsa sp.]|uniref:hypothetical protein n=1 Tax=Thiohalocapsa sp. TaxID=2497641 RepID=UPI0025FA4895|nr:hypothetical protein [Thiohalocapsa sp.]MCG6941575.1 hypothetical protein [Thiohalocapsa sp.]
MSTDKGIDNMAGCRKPGVVDVCDEVQAESATALGTHGAAGTASTPNSIQSPVEKPVEKPVEIRDLGAGWAGWEVSLRGKTAVRLSGQDFFITGRPQPGMWVPKEGSTTALFIYKASNPKRVFRLDYHGLKSTAGRPVWHYNVTKGFAHIDGLKTTDHAVTAGSQATGRALTVFRWGGRALFVVGVGMSVYDVWHAERRAREVVRQVGGWTAGIAAGRYCARVGASGGAWLMGVLGQAGPQAAAPEELVTVPVGALVGGAAGGVGCGVVGMFVGTEVSESLYDWIFTPLEKEEWIVLGETE